MSRPLPQASGAPLWQGTFVFIAIGFGLGLIGVLVEKTGLTGVGKRDLGKTNYKNQTQQINIYI